MIKKKYGAVYTPKSLSNFAAELLIQTCVGEIINTIVDPSSEEGALLLAAKDHFGEGKEYIGKMSSKEMSFE